jgi:hypothetical protein
MEVRSINTENLFKPFVVPYDCVVNVSRHPRHRLEEGVDCAPRETLSKNKSAMVAVSDDVAKVAKVSIVHVFYRADRPFVFLTGAGTVKEQELRRVYMNDSLIRAYPIEPSLEEVKAGDRRANLAPTPRPYRVVAGNRSKVKLPDRPLLLTIGDVYGHPPTLNRPIDP